MMNDDTLLQLRSIKLRRREIEAELKRLDRREAELLDISPSGQAAEKRANPIVERSGFEGAQRR